MHRLGIFSMFSTCICKRSVLSIFSFAQKFGQSDWKCYPSYITRWCKRFGVVNKAQSGSKHEAPIEEINNWVETQLVPALGRYAPRDIYNGDETALNYKTIPHRTYCQSNEQLFGCGKNKDRLTVLMIGNMDGSDKRKLSVIGKTKKPRCLKQKYKMEPKDMQVDWYATRKAWMTGETHHEILTKLNADMRRSNRHILYTCDNASCHQDRGYSNIEVLMLPPNATSVVQPMDQGIIRSTKRRYKTKLAERYLSVCEQDKDAKAMLKSLDVVQATNMLAAAWRETPSSIIQNCFRKAGFQHHSVDPDPVPEEPAPAPTPAVWNRVQTWLGDIPFDEFADTEPEQAPSPPLTDDEIVDVVLTENTVEDEEDDDEEESQEPTVPPIKNSSEFLSMIDQQKAYFARNNLPTDLLTQLEAQVLATQSSICNKQKNLNDYFTKMQQTPQSRRERFHDLRSADELSFVESLDINDSDDIEIASINTSMASSAVNALMRDSVAVVTPPRASTPRRPSTAKATKRPAESCDEQSKKKPRRLIPAHLALEAVKALNDSDVTSLADSDTESTVSTRL